jgi:hypothetical protein
VIPLFWQFVLMGGLCGAFCFVVGWVARGRTEGAECSPSPKDPLWPSSPPDQKCRQCGSVGYSLDEFLSPHTGLCSKCSQSYAPLDLRTGNRALQRAETSVQREIENASVFQTSTGETIESPRPWDKNLQKFGGPQSIPYEELEGMFLDQFLIRFFHSLMPQPGGFFWTDIHNDKTRQPWEIFTGACAWAKEMPLLFEQMTGYALNEIQLNNAIAEYACRLSKSPRADTPGPHETMETPHQSYTGI